MCFKSHWHGYHARWEAGDGSCAAANLPPPPPPAAAAAFAVCQHAQRLQKQALAACTCPLNNQLTRCMQLVMIYKGS